jgi:hypothetical protein
MNNISTWLSAMLVAVTSTIYPQKALTEKFTGAEFLEWSQTGQDTYIGTSITMAAMVAGRASPEKGACLDKWYAANEAQTEARNEEIRGTIARNPEYHPSAEILLVMEGACGAFAAN